MKRSKKITEVKNSAQLKEAEEVLAELEAARKRLEDDTDCLSRVFLSHVKNHDREGIIRLAEAAMFFKDKMNGKSDVDPERASLLYLRMELEKNPKARLTLRDIAAFLGQPMASEDGFSALRRKCKVLGVPYAEVRKIRNKKSVKRLK